MINFSDFSAVIFDMDGVIVDNQWYHLNAWKIFCKKHGLAFDESTFRANYFGKSNHEIICALYGGDFSLETTLKLGNEKEIIYQQNYISAIKPLPGLVKLLEDIKRARKPAAIASSAPIINIDFVLDSLRIREYFDKIVDVSMVKNSKPNPEIYLKAASLLNVPPQECLVFEDSHSGINAALAAGMAVIAVATTHSKEELSYELPKINNFEELYKEPQKVKES
ncbi:MAG: HAD family hydrolase [Bacteroidales bacterium]